MRIVRIMGSMGLLFLMTIWLVMGSGEVQASAATTHSGLVLLAQARTPAPPIVGSPGQDSQQGDPSADDKASKGKKPPEADKTSGPLRPRPNPNPLPLPPPPPPPPSPGS